MAIAFVQSDASGSASIAFGSGNTAGNLLVAIIGTAGDPTGVTDTAGNTWVKATEFYNGGTFIGIDIWYAKNCLSGANTVSFSGGFGSPFDGIIVAEFSGIDTTSPFDQEQSAEGDFATATPNSGNITTTQADEVLIGGAAGLTGVGLTWTGSFTELEDLFDGQRKPGAGYRIVSSTSTYAATATCDTSPANGGWVAAVASFKAAGAGRTTKNTRSHRLGVRHAMGWRVAR
jgi:hypothetical protein